MLKQYIMRNRQLPLTCHGEGRNEYILYNDAGEMEKLEVTGSTAKWIASISKYQFTSPAHYYQTCIAGKGSDNA